MRRSRSRANERHSASHRLLSRGIHYRRPDLRWIHRLADHPFAPGDEEARDGEALVVSRPANGAGTGVVYLVGAGPGDPGLITVRGRELLESCDAIGFD